MDATIIAASLNSDELKKSIDSLVNYVKTGMGQIKSSVDSAVEGMQKSFNFKMDSPGGTSCVAKQQREVTQAVKETEVAYDQLAQAQQKATAPKSARDSYYAFVQGFKEQGAAIAKQIQEAESALNQAVSNRVAELNAKLENAKRKLNELYTTLYQEQEKARSAGTLGMPYNAGIERTQQAIEYTKKHIEELNKSIANVSPNMFSEQVQQIEQLRARREQVLNTMKEETNEHKKQEAAIQQTTNAAHQQETTEEQRISKIKEEWELEQKLHQEQGKRYDVQNEINRQLEIENSKTAENLAFQEKINAARAAKEGGVGKRVRETNELTGAIAGLLGIQEKEVAVTNVEGASQQRLANYLNQLKTAYQKLDKEGMNASHGKMLADEIQRVSRAYAEMTKQMNRPTSLKNALGLDESTLDRIAYKMQQLNAYKRGLNLQTQQGEIKQVDAEIKRLNDDLTKYMSTGRRVGELNNALARSWNYMKNRLAFYFTVGASTQFVKQLAEVRGEYEMTERALGVLVDSAQKGTQIFNELSQMALISPYTLIELSSAARQLTAYGVAAKDVVETTRRVADMAAAVGAPIERLTYALGHVQTYGYLTSLQARQFINAGIPIVKELSNLYTQMEGRMVSVADVYDRMKKKAVSYNDVMQVVNQMTDEGGRFFNFQAKMADTLKVQLANLDLAYKNMLNDIGKSTQGPIVNVIKALKELFLRWKDINTTLRSLGIAFGVVKLAQILYIAYTQKVGVATAAADVASKKMVATLYTMKGAFTSLMTSPLTWWTVLVSAVVAAGMAFYNANEKVKEFNQSLRDNAKENKKNIEEFISTNDIASKVGSNLTGQDELEKMWDSIREQIELTSASSEELVNRLSSIGDVRERVSEGLSVLQDIQAVNSAMEEMGDKAISIKEDMSDWWNLWMAPPGLIGSLNGYYNEIEQTAKELKELHVEELGFTPGETWIEKFIEAWGESNAEELLRNFRADLKETTDSIMNFIELKGWSGDETKITEVFNKVRDKILEDGKLNPERAFQVQLGIEEARSQAAKMAQAQRLDVLAAEYKAETDEEVKYAIAAEYEKQKEIYDNWESYNGRSKAEWERFTKWLKEQHIAETTAMFRNMDSEQIKSLDFQSGEYGNFVDKMVTKYAKEHKMSYDEAFNYLRSWVTSANQWSIFIPLIIGTEEKSVEQQLGEYDATIDKADATIKRLTTRINELREKQKRTYEEQKELDKAEKERADAEKAKAEAESKGGHGKQEAKDAKNAGKAAAKAQRQAESELQKTLKEELSLINQIRNAYKSLIKQSESRPNAIYRAVDGYEETIERINNVLQKYGVEKFDATKFAGINNPRELVSLLQAQLNTLVASGLVKTSEVKDLQVEINKLKLDARIFDLDAITKGLNNELDKIKDEYELAVELDANPELGNMFTEMFGIDTADFPKTIDEYMNRAQQAFDKARFDLNLGAPLDIFKASDDDWYKWGEAVGYSGEQVDNFKKNFAGAVGVAKKWAQDVVNNTKKLEYELAELNDKIAIKEKEQARLHEQIENEKNEVTKHYLELTYQNNQKAIDELRSQALSLMPEYARVFNSIAEYSSGVSRRLQRDLMRVFDNAKYDSANKTWTLTGSDGKPTILNDTQYRKEREKLTREMRKSQAPFKKIKEAFKPSDENGVVDYAKGIELVSAEVQKLGSVASEIGNLAQIFGADEQTVEIINDVATSLDGVATAGQGVAQIASGDYIGGAASVLSGMASAISTWFDNSDKAISAQVKSSELAVKRLETTYKKLDYAIQEAYGAAVTGAKQAAIANKELQLVELQRQLRLEQSRDAKHYDAERVEDLRGQIIDLRNEIDASYKEIVNSLLGISSVGDAAESFMDAYINALRSGEDANEAFKESTQDMIANLIKKIYVTKVIGPQLEAIVDEMNERLTNRSKSEAEAYRNAVEKYTNVETLDDEHLWWWATMNDKPLGGTTQTEAAAAIFAASGGLTGKDLIDWLRNYYKEEVAKAKRTLDNASAATLEDIDFVAQSAADIIPTLEATEDEIRALLDKYGLIKDTSDKTLSALQQGIQGITEDTAGALEAITNGISQQCYLQSDLLTQIRDAVVSMDVDVSLGVMSQILLQLQSSYQIQQSMLLTMENWTNPSGNAVRVELL